jgi:hypothetical protein
VPAAASSQCSGCWCTRNTATSVRNILIRASLLVPAPRRDTQSWRGFLRRGAWRVDPRLHFFTVRHSLAAATLCTSSSRSAAAGLSPSRRCQCRSVAPEFAWRDLVARSGRRAREACFDRLDLRPFCVVARSRCGPARRGRKRLETVTRERLFGPFSPVSARPEQPFVYSAQIWRLR